MLFLKLRIAEFSHFPLKYLEEIQQTDPQLGLRNPLQTVLACHNKSM